MKSKVALIAVYLFLASLLLLPTTSYAIVTPGWGEESSIGMHQDINVEDPSIAMLPDGEAFVVWSEEDSLGDSLIYWNHFTPENGWSNGNMLYYLNGENINPILTTDDATGSVLAFWLHRNFTEESIWAMFYDQNTGWGFPRMVTNTTEHCYPIGASVQGGNATLLWIYWDPSYNYVFKSCNFDETSWSSSDTVGSTSANFIWPLAFASTPDGDIYYAYLSGGYPETSGYVLMYSNSAWSTVNITEPGKYIGSMGLDVTPDGEVLLVYMEASGTYPNMLTSLSSMTYSPSSGWSSKMVIPNASDIMREPIVQVDEDGNAVVLYVMGSEENATVSMLTDGNWSEPIKLDPEQDGYVSMQLNLAMGPKGDAIAIWERDSPNSEIVVWGAIYHPDVGWSVAEKVQRSSSSATAEGVGVDGQGNGIAIWTSFDGSSRTLFANYYTAVESEDPILEIDQSIDGITTENATIVISGSTDPSNIVTIGGVTAAVDERGHFKVNVALEPGINSIDISATSPQGRTTDSTVQVTYDDQAQEAMDRIDELNGTIMLLGIMAAVALVVGILGIALYLRGRKVGP